MGLVGLAVGIVKQGLTAVDVPEIVEGDDEAKAIEAIAETMTKEGLAD